MTSVLVNKIYLVYPLCAQGSILRARPGAVRALDQDAGVAAPVRYSVAGEGAALVRVGADSGELSATAALLQRDAFDYTVVLKVSM